MLFSLFEVIQSLYFATYGLLDVRKFDLHGIHGFTEFMGKTLFGTYSAIMIVVLINMLIAMLSLTFQGSRCGLSTY